MSETGLTNAEIIAAGVERIDGPPPVALPTTQRRGDPGGALTGPSTAAAYKIYFGEEIWRHRVGGEDVATAELKRLMTCGSGCGSRPTKTSWCG